MNVSKGQSQPEIVAAAFLFLYMVLGSPFLCQVLIVTQLLPTPALSTIPVRSSAVAPFGQIVGSQVVTHLEFTRHPSGVNHVVSVLQRRIIRQTIWDERPS